MAIRAHRGQSSEKPARLHGTINSGSAFGSECVVPRVAGGITLAYICLLEYVLFKSRQSFRPCRLGDSERGANHHQSKL